jgi:KamA family protein
MRIGGSNVRFIQSLDKIEPLSEQEKQELAPVVDEFVFRTNTYYTGLIDWDDPNDPIRNIIIPRTEELEENGVLDASDERGITVAHGVEHKYSPTTLLLVSEVCGAYCRFCFRKRLFMKDNDEVSPDVTEGLRYISQHPEIDNVLLTGGDPLMLSNRRLEHILSSLREFPHVKIIRLGTKMPAFDPFRITEDKELQDILHRYSEPERKIYVMVHFNHPRELTPQAVECLQTAMQCGCAVTNQTPLLGNVNDNPDVIAELFNRLAYMGVPPYYLFHGRPTKGNNFFRVTLKRGYEIFLEAHKHMSGLARRARYCMSHVTGKIETVGIADGKIFLRYHQAKNPENHGKFMVFPLKEDAAWFDDLLEP